jgi:CarD family transcriptional regulator
LTSAPTAAHEQGTPTLAVGDVVVYASHGVGRITAVNSMTASAPGTIVVECAGTLTVSLPFALAGTALRPVSGERELAQVKRTLRGEECIVDQTWSKRLRANREKLGTGGAVGLAEIVRDGAHRERRLVERRGKVSSPSERDLCRRARQLLADEIGSARGITAEDAAGWIDLQLAAQPTDAAPPE